MKIIETKNAPLPIGSYSQGIKLDKLIFTSGQIPINPHTNELVSNYIHSEINQIINNLDAILINGGSCIQSIIKLTIYTTDMSCLTEVNKIFDNQFPHVKPARSSVEVSALPMNSRIKIEANGLIK